MTNKETNTETNTMQQTNNQDDFSTTIQSNDIPYLPDWDEGEIPDDDDENAEEEITEDADEDLDPFDDDADEDFSASPDADDEDNWDREDDVQGRWCGEIIYGHNREMSEFESAYYGDDRDYDAMNEYYGDCDE